MKERQKFWSVLALLAAVFAVLFIVQATKTQARVIAAPMPSDAKATFNSQCASCHGKMGVRNRCTQNMWHASRYDRRRVAE